MNSNLSKDELVIMTLLNQFKSSMNEAKTEFSKAGLEEKLVVFFFFIKALAGKEA